MDQYDSGKGMINLISNALIATLKVWNSVGVLVRNWVTNYNVGLDWLKTHFQDEKQTFRKKKSEPGVRVQTKTKLSVMVTNLLESIEKWEREWIRCCQKKHFQKKQKTFGVKRIPCSRDSQNYMFFFFTFSTSSCFNQVATAIECNSRVGWHNPPWNE
jgi:hypothetical protein